jgi:hypothetical protein
MTGPKRSLALAVAPSIFADALASVLQADGVDEVIDLTEQDRLVSLVHYDAALVSPGLDQPDADVVIILPPSGQGTVAISRKGVNDHVWVHTVAELFGLLDEVCPAARPRRLPLA